MEKIYMNPYDIKALPKPSLCSDGLNFKLNEVSMLICNKPIPKDEKVYFEVVIKSFTMNTQIKYIPLYLGIHRECSAGLIATECCIGSVFYKVGADYDIIEKYDGTPNGVHTVPIRLYYKMPITNDKIGCMIDPKANTISLYNNGNLIYSFSPTHFNLNTGTYFPCVMTYAAMNINGYVNFGKAGVKAKPNIIDCYSMYGYYYKTSIDYDIQFKVECIPASSEIKEINFTFDNISSYNKGDVVDLYSVSRNNVFTDNAKLAFRIDHVDSNNYDDDGTLIASDKGIPYYTKTYIEFRVHNGTIDSSSCGIPIEIGLSNSQGTILSKSILMRLLHKSQTEYTIREIINRVPYERYETNMKTSNTFSQEEVIGVGFDLQNQSINIYMNNQLMVTVKTSHIEYKNANDMMYFVLHDYGVFTGYVYGYINYGYTDFENSIPDGYMSLWYYYNKFYPIEIDNPPEIKFNLMAIPYLTPLKVYLMFSFYVIGADLDPGEFTGVNLNQLMKTYNIVTDKTEHITPSRSILYLEKLIKDNNNGYYKEALQEETDSSYFSLPIDKKDIDITIDVVPDSIDKNISFDIEPVLPYNKDIDIKFYVPEYIYIDIFWFFYIVSTKIHDIDIDMFVWHTARHDITIDATALKSTMPSVDVPFSYNVIEGEFKFVNIDMVVVPEECKPLDIDFTIESRHVYDPQDINIDFYTINKLHDVDVYYFILVSP